jgi:hypothetical protein
MTQDGSRHSARAPLNAEAQIEGIHGNTDLRITSISIGGVFIANLTVIPAGGPLEVIFNLPDSLGPIRARGIIAYVDTGIGCGMNFLELSEVEQDRIRNYVLGAAQPAGLPEPEAAPAPRPLRRRELRAAISLPCRFWVRSGTAPGRISRGVSSQTTDLSNHGLSLTTASSSVDGLEILSSDQQPNAIAVQLNLPEPPSIRLLGQARWWSRTGPDDQLCRIGLRIERIKSEDRARIFQLVSQQVQSLTSELPLPSSGSSLPLTAMGRPPREVPVQVEVELRILATRGGGLTRPIQAKTLNLSTSGACLYVPCLGIEGQSFLAHGPEQSPNSLMLKLLLPDGEEQALGAVGEPIWARRLEEGDLSLPFLLGVEFRHLRPESRERLHRFLLRQDA